MRLILLCMVTPLLNAQWVNHPTANVPRTPQGRPDLAAPPPKLGGHADFSGIWTEINARTNCPDGPPCVLQMGLPPEARNIGVLVSGGLPFTPASKALVDRRATESSKFDPHARCTPPNYPRAWALPQFRKIVHTPQLMVVLHEFEGSFRQIFIDGRALPDVNNPAWSGYSTGHWDGDTLVVDATGFREDMWLDMLGNPLSDRTKVRERIRRPNFGTLEVEVTVDDPGSYTKPWTVRLDQTIVLDTEIMEEICTDNEKSVSHLVGGGR